MMSGLIRQGVRLNHGRCLFICKPGSQWQHSRPRHLNMKLVCGTSSITAARGAATHTVSETWSPISIFLLLVPAGTFCLGTWQVQRRKWKLNLIAELQAKTTAPPVDFPEDLEVLDELEYQRVKLIGTFNHEREIFLGPRPLMVGGDIHQAGSGLISSGQSGYLVVTPFTLADRNLTVLVNRGWVSRKRRDPETRTEGQMTGLVELTAIVRKTETRAPFMPKDTRSSNIFIYRDVGRMAEMVGSAPVFLDAVETLPGGPQGGQTRVTMRNEHLSYIFTWYSLSLATSYLWYRRFIQGKSLV